ncbi:DUF4192 domain-containing protein [Nocardioides terrisoli]|uniref:DUF4192 domain-containing protein n=1 Tax=Nocardioides terrisoli TaxID=3388267 RepID=UPI00287BAB84|nr:DUF4192 domain-containing protein [Nocardioides marmorisolisilvae]
MTNETYTARTAVDLIAIAPHALGFQPHDDVVLMAFGSPGGTFHARVDLLTGTDDQHQIAEMLVGAVVRNRGTGAAVLIYSTDAEVAAAQGRVLCDRLHAAGVDVIDVVRVEAERYFPALEDGAEGTAYDVTGHPFTTQRVFEGEVVERSREALADTLVGTDEDDREAVARAAEAIMAAGSAPGPVARDAQWLLACLRARLRRRGGLPLTAADAGRVLALCRSIPLRDLAWAEMTRDNAAACVDVWRDLVRRAPDELLPPAAALLGFAAWLAGDGALAWCALDRCTEVDPDYSLAQCIADLLLGAVPPTVWDEMCADGAG